MGCQEAVMSCLKRCRSMFEFCMSGWAVMLIPHMAWAFCGFYVGGGGASLFNDASQVVLMRWENQTVMSLQNNYQGPTEDFAMIIPVPVVLQQDNVKTLDKDVFDVVDGLTAPRLVEYWEQDPCRQYYYEEDMAATAEAGAEPPQDDDGVTVEAQFQVAEYDIVILSTQDGVGLENWLNNENYNIPDSFNEHVQPYIDGGSYFFAAKVDSDKVTYDEAGGAVLSPLRIHLANAEEFKLPIKLGLINANGTQDLIVYTLGIGQRYDIVNRENVTIPTNIQVVNEVRDDFGSFYRLLFAETVEENPGAAITEYSWAARSCDPCPGPMLQEGHYLTLGADALGRAPWDDWVITRIHLRYDATTLGDDLIFREAPPIVGGRERYHQNDDGERELEMGHTVASINNFQARYIIRHPWEGELDCDEPVFGHWGGPDGQDSVGATGALSPNTEGAASDAGSSATGSLPSDDLDNLVYDEIPELGVVPATGPKPGLRSGRDGTGCACNATSLGSGVMGLLLLLGLYRRLAVRRSMA